MSEHAETRRFDLLYDCVDAYGKACARLASGEIHRCSIFQMYATDDENPGEEPFGLITVVGEDEAEVHAEAEELGGVPFDGMPEEHLERMRARRRLTLEHLPRGYRGAGFRYQEFGALREDGVMGRAPDEDLEGFKLP